MSGALHSEWEKDLFTSQGVEQLEHYLFLFVERSSRPFFCSGSVRVTEQVPGCHRGWGPETALSLTVLLSNLLFR